MAKISDTQAVRCQLCGEKAATVIWKDHKFSYGPESDGVVLTARVPVEQCAGCAESVLGDEAETIMHAAICAHLGRLSPAEIKAIRTHFGMLQEEFADLTKYGVASIKRWESGNQIQSESVDNHLRLLRSLGVKETLKRTAPRVAPEFKRQFDDRERRQADAFRLRPPALETDRLAA